MLVAELGSINRASRVLNVTQPALSRQITALEREVGTPLLLRTGHGISLSRAGEIFLKRITEGMRIIEEAKIEATAQEEPAGPISLGVPYTVGAAIAVEAVRKFRERYPKVVIRLLSQQSRILYEWLLAGRIDVAVVYEPCADRDIVVSDLIHEDLFLTGAPSAQIDDEAIVDFEQLAQLPLVMPGLPNGLRVLVENFAQRHGGSLRIELEVEGLEMQKQLIQSGVGFGILPFSAIHEDHRLGTLRAWPIRPAITRRLLCATPPRRKRSAAANALIEHLEAEGRHIVGWSKNQSKAADTSLLSTN